MGEKKSILHELYVFSEWKPEPEYLQKSDNIFPESISALWRWFKFFGPKKSLIDSITAHKERQIKWHMALGDEGKVIAVLTDNILEIRTKRSEYATIAARTTVSRDAYSKWRKVVWSPDCSFVAVAYGNGIVSFFDLTASNLFNIPVECNRPGGLECTDNTHAVADIIFMPLRVKDNKWNWEVLIVTYDGKLRGFLVSLTDGFKLHHSFRFAGGVGAVAYSASHSLLFVAGLPRGPAKDPASPAHAGITAWRILNDDPFYKLSVACDQLEAQSANERFQLYVPFVTSTNLAFIINMAISPDSSKLVCIHCTGEISIWRLPLVKMLYRWPLTDQPDFDLKNPLVNDKQKEGTYCPVDVNWWSNDEIIISRGSGVVTVCHVSDMCNLLGSAAQFLQGAPRVTGSHRAAFMALECETNVLPANARRTEDSMEIETEDTMYDQSKELVKSILYAITDIETFQPKPKRITVVSRIYRLLGIKSTTPEELFSRKIESGNYADALSLAASFNLDSDLVYQQQWRKTPVSTDTIQNYLSKVSKKIWAIHQCVDRLPETLPAAKQLLDFGLKLTNDEILQEINKDRDEDHLIEDPNDITLEDLNSYTSEVLRCRHAMLFYKQRLSLYESIIKLEKSNYVKDEYDRLRSSSVVHSAIELAKEGRILGLNCLWPYVEASSLKMAILDCIPETINPYEYRDLLDTLTTYTPKMKTETIKEDSSEDDWCKKEIFRSIWSSNWADDPSDNEMVVTTLEDLGDWFAKRAREIEERCGLVDYSLELLSLADGKEFQDVPSLREITFHFETLDTLVYDLGMDDVSLKDVEKWTELETCHQLMKFKTSQTFLTDLKEYLVPYLMRNEQSMRGDSCVGGLIEYLQSLSVQDLSWIVLVLQANVEYELDLVTRLNLAEKCILAHVTTDQLDKACDMLATILKESDGTIATSELLRRVRELERLLTSCRVLWWRGVEVPARELKAQRRNTDAAKLTLVRMARTLAFTDKPTQQDWEKLLKDILDVQANLFENISKEQCYEIYGSAQLTSGDLASIRLASEVFTCDANEQRRGNNHLVPYARSVELVLNASKEYFNSCASLNDPALELAKCCLLLIKDGNKRIQEELDLIGALSMLNSYNMNILPIQVRLCEDKMKLVEECMKLDPSAYLSSHKLLKLAKLLRVAGNDELKREGEVLMLIARAGAGVGAGAGAGVGVAGVGAGAGAGVAAAGDAARRLAALRYKPAAHLLTHIATTTQAYVDRNTRRDLFASAVTHCSADCIEEILRNRLLLELEGLEQTGATVTELCRSVDNTTEDEFCDAVTTPVIEKKDLVTSRDENKVPIFNYLIETWHKKFASGDAKPSQSLEPIDRSTHCQEFYHTLYPNCKVSSQYYRYDRFSLPETVMDPETVGQSVLKCYFIQSCLGASKTVASEQDVELNVLKNCAEEVMYRDTALSVACLLRSTLDSKQTIKMLETLNSDTAISAALYATLIKCNTPNLRDNVYLTKPLQMARTTLKQSNATSDQLELIRACLEKLMLMVEINKMKGFGCSVNGLLFTVDADYRKEIIYRMASSTEQSHIELALNLAKKYEISTLELWIEHVRAIITDAGAVKETLDLLTPDIDKQNAVKRLKSEVWEELRGDRHNDLINYFNILKGVDEKKLISGLTPAEHVKLLKKAKAASTDLNYKLLLEQPSADEFSRHILQIINPENVGMLTKLLRTLPPALKIPISVNTLYTMWLTKYFFSVSPTNATTKKWMQQYRQCASYFNKLSKADLLKFVTNTCFSDEAVERVPSGTRNLMIMQAVDYCQQEQENDLKLNKNETSWAQVGQELTRWARFLENFYSTTIQGIIENNIPNSEFWIAIEKSHGDISTMLDPLCRLLLESNIKPATLSTLLQCLNVNVDAERIFQHAVDEYVNSLFDVQTLVSRFTYYRKEGVKLSEDLLETVMQKATDKGLPPHKQITLLSLSQKNRIQDGDDWTKIASFSVDLLKAEWADEDYALELTDENLLNDEGRRETFQKFLELANTWQRKKALVDILNCWPPTRNDELARSLHCDYIQTLLTNTDLQNSLVLIKLLLRKPVLVEEEIKWLSENAPEDSILNLVWTILLSKCEHSISTIPKLVQSKKEIILKLDIDNDLIKELLDNGLFVKLVSTPLYSSISNYILHNTQRSLWSGEQANSYSVNWATEQLLSANLIAEAGHMQLLSMGVPSPLRGFSESVLYFKNFFK